MATEACNEAGPGKSTAYEPKGKTTTVSGLPIYVSGDSKNVILLFYDVLGWGANKNLFELSDRFAVAGYTAVMCDHFRGKPWPSDRLPFKDEKEQEEFFGWVTKAGAPDIFRSDLKDIVFPFLEKDLKATHIHVIGFCWGGLIAFEVSDNPKISGIASIHGSRISPELAAKAKCPVYYGPTPKDTPVEPIKKVLDEKPFAKYCVYHTFEKMEHGFCGSRGDWKNSETKKNVDLVFEQMLSFSKQTIEAKI